MLTMIIKFDGVLNGTEPLLESDMNSDPADQMLGIVEFQKVGTLGRVDPDLVFAGGERHEGFRLDLVHVVQQNPGVSQVSGVRVTSSDGSQLFDVADLTTGTNVVEVQQNKFVPPGYVVELISDAPSGAFVIRLGLVPLLSPVDWDPQFEVIQPE